jgi:Flp pilus assembly protein TadD/uncharacterized protein (AIM24 family)
MASMSNLPGPEQKSAPPASSAERTERSASLLAARSPSLPADSTRDVAQEDFLFHLYRGSELLQENRVFEAKEELEFALTLQPFDPKGQDLLGAVYFRVGLYALAIQIYEGLQVQFSRDVSIKINLALCYIKTGQPEPARATLQETVRLNPEHKRAWGYLGLALQKLGQLEQAQVAFERGGHEMMAKRLTERRQRSSLPAASDPHRIDEGLRAMAEIAFSELDAGELRFALAEPESSPRPSEGPWHTIALGEAVKPRSPYATTFPPASLREQAPVHQVMALQPGLTAALQASVAPAAAWSRRGTPAPPLLVAPPDRVTTLHATGVVLVRVDHGQAFAGRLDALRVVAGTTSTRVLHRRTRDAETHEVLGGIGSPLVHVEGVAELVLGPRPARELAILALDDDLAFVREDMLLGFELRLAYENGRVGLDPDGGSARLSTEGVAVVQLRGTGALILELPGKLAGVPCPSGRPMFVRREWLVGWLGRLAPRALPASESPNGQRGLIGFAGEGTVLVCAG